MHQSQTAQKKRQSRRTFWAAVMALGGAGLIAADARAASIDWDNETGDGRYLNPLNWSSNALPVAGDDAAFVNLLAGPATIDGDIATPPRDFRFGDEGATRSGGGVVNHTSGTVMMPGWVRMGINTAGSTGSTGTYNLSGGMVQATSFRIGESATATAILNVTGGTLRQADGNPGDGGQWNRIGEAGMGTVNLSNGTISFDTRVLMGGAAGSSGTVTQTGGLFEVRHGELTIGDQSTATYNISGGTLRTLNTDTGGDTGGHITVGQWDNSNGNLNVSGNAVVEAGVHMNLANGQATVPSAGTVTQTGGTVRIGINGPGNLDMAGPAPGVATYSLSGGVLDLTGGNILKGAGTATFAMTGGELRNVNSMNFPLVQAGGTLQVGDAGAVGTTALNSYTQGALGTLLIDLGTGGSSDVLDVNGAAILGGLLSLNVLDDSQIPVGTQFTILTPDTLTGAFLNSATLVADTGQPFSISYTGGDGNDVVITAEIPEPGTLGLIALALGGLLGVRRSRRGARV
jgi:hypothetical protein